MTILVADVREKNPTDWTDDAVQRVIDSAVKAIARAAGNATAQVDTGDASGSEWFALTRRSTAFTSVTERRRHSSDEVTLSSDDYRKVGDYKLLRLASGTNGASFWGKEVVATYTPEVDTEVRDRVTLDLCVVDINFQAFDREKSGADWEGEQKDYKARRRELLRQIREGQSPII